MHENPFATILGVVKGVSENSNSPSIQIGKIIQAPPEIKVSYNGIILDKKDVWISEYLLIGYKREAKGHIISETQPRSGGGGDAEFASHTHAIDNDYTDTIIYTDTLKAGDFVAVMPMMSSEDGSAQQYIILDKIVHL